MTRVAEWATLVAAIPVIPTILGWHKTIFGWFASLYHSVIRLETQRYPHGTPSWFYFLGVVIIFDICMGCFLFIRWNNARKSRRAQRIQDAANLNIKMRAALTDDSSSPQKPSSRDYGPEYGPKRPRRPDRG